MTGHFNNSKSSKLFKIINFNLKKLAHIPYISEKYKRVEQPQKCFIEIFSFLNMYNFN